MATAVSICSNALVRLGGDTISSFDEADSDGANIERVRAAANLWPTIRRRVLRGNDWNCAMRRVLLSPDATSPAFGFSYRYQMPSDWLRNVAVGLDERTQYRKEGNYLLTDADTLPLLYVFDNDNPATYDAALVDVLELAMMAALAYPVTKSTSLAAELHKILRDSLAQARALDGQDDPADTLGDNPLLTSRYGRVGGF